jgi:3',5'-cyclic AMP phosphodiesterase CpdA
MKIRIRFLVFLITAAVCCQLSALTVNAAAAGPYNIILSCTDDASSSVTITWHSGDSIGGDYVMFGEDNSLGDAIRVDAAQVEVKSGISMAAYIYKATLSGLKSGKTYYYRVCGIGGKSETVSFTTAGTGTDSFSFMYMGDIQVVSNAEKEYGNWGVLLDNAYKRNPALAFGMLGGDIVESGINSDQWDSFLENASPIFSKIPLMPANGNHESNFPGGKPELYLDIFSLPENGPDNFKEEFYSFNYGSCHITVLNSWVFSGEQKLSEDDYRRISEWIENDLRSSDAVWKIIVMHHPVYSLAGDNVADAVRKNWEPLFLAGGVSLVFCGHQHVYNRSYPMNSGKIDFDDGVTYIMGNAGEKYYSSANEACSEKTIYNTSTYQIVQIDKNNLTVQTFDGDGNELDYYTISPRTASEVTRVFSDVSDNAWYAEAVKYVAGQSLMTGTSTMTFSPDNTLTRAMFATVLYRLAGSPSADTSSIASFIDVETGQWYYNAVAWAINEGIVQGYGGGLFGTEDAITREQLAAILYRYAVYMGMDEWGDDHIAPFPDASNISNWAEPAMRWATDGGLISGLPDGTLAPQVYATRAQCAEILMKFSGTDKPDGQGGSL